MYLQLISFYSLVGIKRISYNLKASFCYCLCGFAQLIITLTLTMALYVVQVGFFFFSLSFDEVLYFCKTCSFTLKLISIVFGMYYQVGI